MAAFPGLGWVDASTIGPGLVAAPALALMADLSGRYNSGRYTPSAAVSPDSDPSIRKCNTVLQYPQYWTFDSMCNTAVYVIQQYPLYCSIRNTGLL